MLAYVFEVLAVLSVIAVPGDPLRTLVSGARALTNARPTMSGSKRTSMKMSEARRRSIGGKTHTDVERVKRAGDYVWDGVDEDERPSTKAELAAAKKLGRPRAAVTRTMLSLRVDPDVLAALRASGRGWQTRVNALLREAVTKGKI
jgi:uncharacterized protein (DUF4415 family)